MLLDAVRGARRVVEIGVYEGASAVALCALLGAGAELHLIDPFGTQPDALPGGWAGSEWATRRAVARARRARGAGAPRVQWHIGLSQDVVSELGGARRRRVHRRRSLRGGVRARLARAGRRFVAAGGHVVFHDARADRHGGRGLPGPTAVVGPALPRGRGRGWEIAAEADRTGRRAAARARPRTGGGTPRGAVVFTLSWPTSQQLGRSYGRRPGWSYSQSHGRL